MKIEMKDVPKNIIKEIDTLLWDFLWDRKQPLVSKQTMFLILDNGSVNMINLMHFVEAKRIKFIHKILNSETEHWNMKDKYWLSSSDKNYDSENFLFYCCILFLLFLHNSTKMQYHHGVLSEVYYKQMIKFLLLSSKYVVIIKFYAATSPYASQKRIENNKGYLG